MDLGPPWKRRRPATACTHCRRRKIRCDGAAPCGPCSRPPGRRCEYAESPFYESRLDQPPQQDAFMDLNGRGQTIKPVPDVYDHGQDLDLFAVDAADTQFAGQHAVPSNLASYFPIQDIPMITGPPLPCPCPETELPLESPALTNAPSVSSGMSTHARSTPSRGGNSPPFGSGSACSPMGSGYDGPDLDPVLEQRLAEDKGFWMRSLDKCDKLQFLSHGLSGQEALRPGQERLRPLMDRFSKMEWQQLEATETSPSDSPFAARGILPPRSTCDVLVDAYMNTFETVLRILHVPSFLREYERLWRRPMASDSIETDEPLLCMLIVILALGSTVVVNLSGASAPSSPGAAEDRAYLQKQSALWISYGKQWLTRRMVTAQRTDLSVAQTMCLLALVRHVHTDDVSATGMLVSPGDFDLARIGMQMGLHRDPFIRTPDMPAREAEMRRRLWATMVELSLQRSLDEGLPTPLSPESFDCQPPSDVTDEELETEHGPSGLQSSLRELTSSTLLVLLARTQRLRLRCLHLVNSPGASKSYDDSHTLASELSAACGAYTDILRAMARKPSDFQLQLLQTYTWQFVRALHEPFAEQASGKPSFHYSRKVQMEAAVRMLGYPPSRVLATAAEAESLADSRSQMAAEGRADGCMSLRVHGQGYLGRVQRQAAVSLCLNLCEELEDGAFKASDGASWRRMHSIVRDTVSVYERRVRVSRGTHGKRELVFLVSAEAYICSMLRGFSPREEDETVNRAAEKVLSACCEVMGGVSR